ncbi:MAG TPA: hypothetical protein PK003_10610 [Bacillota bacterium]|nr:hypothetical protein [Bacillota bacterium]
MDLTHYLLELGQKSTPESVDWEDYIFRLERDLRYAIALSVGFTAPDASPVAHKYPGGRLEVTFPEGLELRVLYGDPDDFAFAPEPAKTTRRNFRQQALQCRSPDVGGQLW